MKVVVLGAGSTIGTFDKSLGVGDFVKRLSEVHPSWESEYGELKRAVQDCDFPDLDKIWAHVDYASKLKRSLPGRPAYPEVSGQLRKALIRTYSLNAETEALRCELRRTASVFTLKTVLGGLCAGDSLLSFNWDTVAERVARDLSIPRLVAAGPPPLDYRRVNLIKPHGSLSWEDRGTSVKWEEAGDPLFDPMSVDSVHRSSYLQPLVLGAVPIKVELHEETQPNRDIYTVIADQWGAAVEAVARATELIVVGYGFPPEDRYGRFLFREAAKLRGAPVLPTISYYSLPEDTCKVEEALRDIFGKDVTYTFKGRVKGAGVP